MDGNGISHLWDYIPYHPTCSYSLHRLYYPNPLFLCVFYRWNPVSAGGSKTYTTYTNLPEMPLWMPAVRPPSSYQEECLKISSSQVNFSLIFRSYVADGTADLTLSLQSGTSSATQFPTESRKRHPLWLQNFNPSNKQFFILMSNCQMGASYQHLQQYAIQWPHLFRFYLNSPVCIVFRVLKTQLCCQCLRTLWLCHSGRKRHL